MNVKEKLFNNPQYISKSFVILIMVNLVLISFSYVEFHSLFLFFYFILSIVLFFTKKEYLIILFILFLPTNGIISSDDYLFGILGINQINFISMMLFFLSIKNNNKPTLIQNNIKFLIYALIVSYAFEYFKDAVYGIGSTPNFTSASRKFINLLSKYIPLLLLINNLNHPKIFNLTFSSIFPSIFGLVVYAFFSSFLPEIGLKSFGNEVSSFGIDRVYGVVADGDSNTFGTLIAMSIGFILLANSKSSKIIYNLLILICLLAVASSGSRASIISLILVLLVYYFISSFDPRKLWFILIISLVVVFSFESWIHIVDRFSLVDQQFNTETSSNRIGKWILYINFVLKKFTEYY